MNKFQDVAFHNINDLLDYLPEEELKIVERLRKIIFDCIPDAKEKLAYNVPFFYRHSRICFIWPGSVAWGKTKKSGVELGFCKGHLLTDTGFLEKGDRKEVYIKTFYHLRQIDADPIRQLLFEAILVDESSGREKNDPHLRVRRKKK